MPALTKKTFSYRLFRFVFGLFFRVWFRLKVFHRGRVPKTGGVILASNHVCYFDPVFVVSSLERMVVGLTRESAFKFPINGFLLRSWRMIPVDQSGSGRGLKTFLSRVRGGDAVIMYPEGTRSPTGQIQAPQPGIGLIIIKSEEPVIPIKIFGAYEAYGRHICVPRPYEVQIKFGEPLDFAELRAEAKQTKNKERLKEIYKKAATDLLHTIAQIEPGQDQN